MATSDPEPITTGPAGPGPLQLVLTWPGEGRAGATVAATGPVTVAQLMEAAFLLDCMARESRQAAMQRAAMAAIVPAGLGDLAGLKRS